MKAFLISMVALVVVTAAAAYGLNALDMSAAQVYSSKSGDVRL